MPALEPGVVVAVYGHESGLPVASVVRKPKIATKDATRAEPSGRIQGAGLGLVRTVERKFSDAGGRSQAGNRSNGALKRVRSRRLRRHLATE